MGRVATLKRLSLGFHNIPLVSALRHKDNIPWLR